MTPATLAAPVVTMLIGIGAARYESRRAQELGSDMLAADARHTLADAGVTLALMGGLLAVRAGYPIVDPLVALGIAVVVARVGVSILRQSSQVLADSAVLDPAAVATAARQVPGVVDAHKIRSRGAATDVAVDLHIQVDPDLGIERAHAIAHEVSDTLKGEFAGVVDVVVHVEPMWSEVEDEILRAVRRALAACHVQAHDVSVHVGERTEACLHLELDPELSLDEAHAIASAVEDDVRRRVPSLHRVVTHLEPRPQHPPVACGPGAGDHYAVLLAQAAGEVDGLGVPHAVETVRLPSGVCLSAHIEASGALTLAAAHSLAEELEERLRALAPDVDRVFLHVEPPAVQP
ncbi:MAG: cation diffusion facilitator family transporter [Anaerolineae bacterium]